MKVFFPVSEDEHDALLRHARTYAALAGLDRVAWDNPGVVQDAIWVTAELSDDVARRYEERAAVAQRVAQRPRGGRGRR